MPGEIQCSQCQQPLVQVGKHRICPEHGQLPASQPFFPLRIFLSYGHDANEDLVRRIKADLEKRGHDVWFDKAKIKFGDDWRRTITDGILKSNRVLSFLSRHSTRDPGVCRDEIAIAIGVRGGNIQTILVESEQEVQPPVNIGHIQWLDMHDWKDRHEKDEAAWGQWYQEKLTEIVQVVESDESRRFAGEIEKLTRYLKPIKSDARIYELLKRGFYGRLWLFEAAELWRQDTAQDSRLFWIMGAPGVGKSAFAAQLTHTRGDVVIAAQFCEWDKPDHRNAERLVRSIAFQLATRLPDYRKLLLTLPEIDQLDGKNATELFDYILANPLRLAIHRTERCLIVIDALDEAYESGINPLVDMLARNAHRLPEWLSFIVTSRPEFNVKASLQELNPVLLNAESEFNRADIREYLWRELESQLPDGQEAHNLVERILEKSEGVFLYVERFCQDVRQGLLSLERPEQFPKGLGGSFLRSFQRQFADIQAFRTNIRPALRVILAAREPLPVAVLQHLFNRQDEELEDSIHALGSLFTVMSDAGRDVIKPYHKSVSDWLADKGGAGPYFVSPLEGHRMLAQAGLTILDKGISALDAYLLKHLPAHLAAADRKYDLERLLLNFQYLEAKCHANCVDELIADFDLVSMSPVHHILQQAVQLSSHGVRQAPYLLAGQMRGRLLGLDEPVIRRFIDAALPSRETLWLNPAFPCLTAPGGPLVRILEGHTGSVRDVAITPDGRLAVSGSDDKTLKVWDLATGKEVRSMKGHPRSVNCVAITPDGRFVVSGSDDHTLKVWDLATAKQDRSLQGHRRHILCVAITPDGRFAVSGSDDKTLKVWDLVTGNLVTSLEGHTNIVTCVGITPDGKFAVSGSDDRKLRVWDLPSGCEVRSLEGHTRPVTCAKVTPDGRFVVSGAKDRLLKVWKLATGEEVHTLAGHTSSVCCLEITPDGRFVASGARDNTLRVWELATGEPVQTLTGHASLVNCVRITPDGRFAVSGSDDNTLRVWDLATNSGVHGLQGHRRVVTCIGVTPDGRFAVSGSRDKTLIVWEISTGKSVRSLRGHGDWVRCVGITPDGRFAVSGSDDKTMKIWELSTGLEIGSIPGHTSDVTCLGITPDGRFVVSGSEDKTLKVWDLVTGTQLPFLLGHKRRASCIAITPDGRFAVTGSWGNTVKLWELATGEETKSLEGHSKPVSCVAVTPDGRFAISGSKDTTLKVWELATGKEVRTLHGHKNRVNCIGITADGRFAVSGSYDRMIIVWRLATGERLTSFTFDTDVTACAVTTDMKSIVVGAGNVFARLDFEGIRIKYGKRHGKHNSDLW